MNTTNNTLWQQKRGHVKTRAGQWIAGKDAKFRKHSLLNDLIHRLTETQLMVYAITGRIITSELSTWIEKAYFMTSYPDSRLWCNNIASLAAHTTTSPVAATVAGFLASDSKAYGSYAVYRSALFLCEFQQQYLSGTPIPQMIEAHTKKGRPPKIPGFLRPIRVKDERLEPMATVTKNLGFKDKDCMSLAKKISAEIEKNYGNGMNAAAYYAAFLLDQNFSPKEIYLLCVRCAECGILACYQDHISDVKNSFLPLHCSDITYTGPEKRTVKKHS